MFAIALLAALLLFILPAELVRRRERLAPRDLAPGGAYVEVEGRELWYADEGDPSRRPVVLLHGFASWSFGWRAQRAALLDAGERVITLDMLGSGASARAAAPVYATADHARRARAVLAALGVRRALIVGHSFGGRVAIQVAADDPDLAEGLALIAPEAFATERPPIARAVALPLVGFALTCYTTAPSLVRTGLKLTVRRADILSDELVAGYAAPLRVRGSVLAQVWQARSPKDGGRPVPELLGQVRCPALIVWGAEDPIFPAADGARLAERIPGADLHVLPGVGHLPYEEAADATSRLLVAFAAGGTAGPSRV